MEDEKFKTLDILLEIYHDNEFQLNDVTLHKVMNEKNIDRKVYFPLYLLSIYDYKLLRRHPDRPEIKYLTEKGYSAYKLGSKMYFTKLKRRDINLTIWDVVKFLFPLIISAVALYFSIK